MCIKLVALHMNLYQEVALSLEKVGDPWTTVYIISYTCNGCVCASTCVHQI